MQSASSYLLAALLLLAASGSPATEPPPIALVGVNVVTMGKSGTLPDRTVVVREGRIAAIQASDLPIEQGIQRIDGQDNWLIPGLIDSHVHLEYFSEPEELQLYLAYGVTTVRNMDGRPHILEWRQRQAAGEILGPTIYTSGPLLDGDPPVWDDNVVLSTPTDAATAVAAAADLGYDQIKVYDGLQPEVYRALLKAAAKAGLPVVGHAPFRVGLARVLEQKQHSIEHFTGYYNFIESDDSPTARGWAPQKRFVGVPADPAKLQRSIELTAASDTWNCPTLVMHEHGYPSDASSGNWKLDEGTEQLTWLRRLTWEALDWFDRDRGTAEAVAAARKNRYDLVRLLHAAGAPLLAGTDAGTPFIMPGTSLAEELSLMVDAGLTPADALRTATSDAGNFLTGDSADIGTIEIGRYADLVLLSDDPTDDISAITRIEGVVVRGNWLDTNTLKHIKNTVRW